jgi:phosphotransferase system enzyme I (PtsI)
MKHLCGLSGAPGYILGTAIILNKKSVVIEQKQISDVNMEIAIFNKSREKYKQKLENLAEKAGQDTGKKGKAIFEAYQQILGDNVFFNKAIKRVENDKVNIEYAIDSELKVTTSLFEKLDDDYLKERGNDIKNVCMELITEIQGVGTGIVLDTSMGNRLVVVAEDLTPADTMLFDKSILSGFVTEKGGVTSHTVILAKSLGIPAIVGVKGAVTEIGSGETVILDGFGGNITVSPNTEQLAEFKKRKKAIELQSEVFAKFRGIPAVTKDGVKIQVNINSGDKNSITEYDSSTCDGIGLFRTEFLYMNRDCYPTEDEQFEVYKAMAEKANGKEFIIRTLDIGGDKQVGYMNLPKENNPFLGYRAIRICLDRVDVFKAQLRAILRASVYDNVKIMFPMIVNLEELLRAKTILEEIKSELESSGVKYNKNIPVGIMVETPAAVMLSDKLAEEVSFFSIGSNDLIQYTTATDRMNETIQWLYDSYNISILRSIKMVCDNAQKCDVKVGICGEVASEGRLVPLFVAMGVQELSVAPSQVGKVKYIVNRISAKVIQDDLNEILSCGRIDDVKSRLSEIEKKIMD